MFCLLPIGLLMKEHRLVEELVSGAQVELNREREKKTVNFVFLETAIDFFRTYADRCHHGKEENILFRELEKKQLPAEVAKTMRELVEEHVFARRVVSDLYNAKAAFALGNTESLSQIMASLQTLIEFYPKHIAKEDKAFFYPAMAVFSAAEQEKMLAEFYEFDRQLIHEKYQGIVENALTMLQRVDLTKWKCTVCDYVYDPLKGDPTRGIKAGTAFKELPENWTCPVCFAPKSAFKEMK
jgi:hemerythrin-like domain-containing protein/rubredoxin